MSNEALLQEIQSLKQKTGAVILAHNYVAGEIQDIADFTGDSLELSIKARDLKAKLILFCGVRFMAETAKLLSPESIVLLPNSDAGCPMADMASAEQAAKCKAEHPDAVLCAYVNSTAATKAHVDICCTSGNVEKVLQSIPPEKQVVFLPDRNLGANMTQKLNRPMDLWDGFCPTHNLVTESMIERARSEHPDAKILIHPECRPAVVKLCDAALSTGGILRYVRESKSKEFIICTESGILHRLKKENPKKHFFPLQPPMICANMKKITLENVRDSLKEMREQIEIDPAIREAALAPITRMLDL